MEVRVFVALNGPISISAILLNIFFAMCLLFSQSRHGAKLQQPLKVLLISMVSCSFTLQLTILLYVFEKLIISEVDVLHWGLDQVFFVVSLGSLSSVTWLSIFYFINIVPNKLFVSVKRNIKTVVYIGLAVDRIILLVTEIVYIVAKLQRQAENQAFNSSSTLNITAQLHRDKDLLYYVREVSTMLYTIYLIICLVTMMVSWGNTYIYLRKHMKNMEESSGFSQPQLKSQMRVTVTGLVQLFLYLPFCLWKLMLVFTYHTPAVTDEMECTVAALFSLCSSICLAFSQSVFRERTVSVFERVSNCKS